MMFPSFAARQERSRLLHRALASALLCCACQRVPLGATVIESLQVSDGNLAGNPDLGVSSEAARRAMKSALEATGKFVVRERQEGAEGGEVRVRLQGQSGEPLSCPH